MAWIKSFQELRDHPKTRRLARILTVPIPHAIGMLHCFWWWCLDYAPDGNLTKFMRWELAEAAKCEEDGDVFVKAMIDSGFIDATDDDEIIVHDWDEYTGALVEQRIANRQRAKKAYATRREKKSPQSLCVDNAQSEQSHRVVYGAREDKSRLDKIRQDKRRLEDTTPPRGERVRKPVDYSADFETFWQSYPRRVDKQRAWQNWKTELKSGSSAEDMIRAAKNYAKMCAAQRREVDKIKHPSTFLGRDRSWMEYVEGVPEEGISVYERSAKRSLDQIAEDFRLGLEMYDEEVIDVDARELGGILQIDGGS